MKSLTKDELSRLLTVAKKCSERDHLMILVAFWHGLRASEVVNLRGRDIRFGHVRVKRLKGSDTTIQPYKCDSNPLFDESIPLDKLDDVKDDDTLLFPMTRQNFYRLVRKYGYMAGIPAPKCHPHVLKHTFGRLYIDTLGVPKMQKRLGHKSGSSTLKYTEFSEDEVNAAVEELSI